MVKILVVSDDGVSSGYGRISTEINRRLLARGHQLLAASLQYDGLLPAQYDGERIPYHVACIGGRPNWADEVHKLALAFQPDVIWTVQDAPFAQTVRSLPLDWSKVAFIMTTPVDGSPIHPAWIQTAKQADAVLTISEFGVEEWRKAGVTAGLCRPGINNGKFYRLPDSERLAIRAKLDIAPDAFVVGVMAMNQGRKAIPQMMRAFFDFALDKPDARLILDMEATSPAGWDLVALCEQFGWERKKVIFRHEAAARGVYELRERYNVLDVHAVLAFREGFGLPILEAMACGAISAAQDWCAGTEVVKDGRGLLVPSLDYFMPSTWGGALDKLPDYSALAKELQRLHDNPEERKALARRGMEWAVKQTWDTAAQNCFDALDKALARKKPAVNVHMNGTHAIMNASDPLVLTEAK